METKNGLLGKRWTSNPDMIVLLQGITLICCSIVVVVFFFDSCQTLCSNVSSVFYTDMFRAALSSISRLVKSYGYSRLSFCGQLAITDTKIIRTAFKFPEKLGTEV